ncbi:hypothetical protein BGZ60DRAFT_424829 [Tricladium varicosporioides]|nr:hypothetical protein BGZ60DRAFT_424829 [Hymenoscyphus varicosporioides]
MFEVEVPGRYFNFRQFQTLHTLIFPIVLYKSCALATPKHRDSCYLKFRSYRCIHTRFVGAFFVSPQGSITIVEIVISLVAAVARKFKHDR